MRKAWVLYMTPILELSHLEKSFGNHVILRDINFKVNAKDVISVIGASGSGKSTMLAIRFWTEKMTYQIIEPR